jgi:predicted Zn-ribbon and HTH transcriptional regulator
MARKELIPLLLDNPMTVSEIARRTEQSPGDAASDLEHLLLSLPHTEYEAAISPARCRKCRFEFGPDKLRKPSKCPKCKSTWLSEALIQVRARPRKTEAEK